MLYKETKRRWRKNNPDKVRAYGRVNAALFKERHPVELKAIKKKEYDKHRESYIERAREWRLANPERYRQQMRKAYQKAKAIKLAKRCMSCEALSDSYYCNWCVQTYKLCLPKKIQQSHDLKSALTATKTNANATRKCTRILKIEYAR